MNRISFFTFLILSFLVTACGYHLRGFGDNLPADVETIKVIPFSNETYEADMERLLSMALAEEFSRARRIRVVYEGDADLILGGAIKSFSNNAASFSTGDVVLDYRISVAVDATLTRRDNGEILWKGKNLKEFEDYRAEPGSTDTTELNKDEAKRLLAEELAELIYDRVFEGF